MQVKSSVIVLSSIKYNDTSNIVEVFSKEMGRVSFIVKIPKTSRAAVKRSLFQPMSLLELEWNHRLVSNLQRIQSAKSYAPFVSLPYNPYKASIALFLAEFLRSALHEEQAHASLYAYIESSVLWLDACERSFANFHLVFLIRMSRFLGFYPNLEGYEEGCYFDMLNSCFMKERPFHSHFVMPAEAARLPLLMRMNYETMRLFGFSRNERDRLIAFINNYYCLHIPNFPQLKSLDVLRELFS